MSLSHRTYSAVRWTTISTVVRAGLQLAQLLVLTRFLTPREYGLMAIVTVVLGYANLFGDMGLGAAFVHRQQVTQAERSSLYWLNVFLASVLMIVVMAVSPLAARFLDEWQLVPLMMLTATNLLVSAVGQQLRMEAEKSLKFRPVAAIEITASIAGFAVAVLAAWAAWGVYALVAASMVSTWLTMGLSWAVLAQGWRPAWRLRLTEVQPFVRFGGGLVVNNLMNQFNSTVDLFLGGRLLGASQLGLYSVPRNLVLQIQFMVNPIVTRVGFPLIASIQHDQARVRAAFLRTMNITASLNAPIYIALSIFSPEIVALLVGDEWVEVGPLLRVMALWGLFRSFGNPVGSLLLGLGCVGLSAKWNAGLLLVVPPAVWFGSQFGAIGIAWALFGLMALLFLPGWAILVRPTCGAGLWEYARQVLAPTICALLAGAAGWAAALPLSSAFWRLAAGLGVGAAVYVVMTCLINRSWSVTAARAIGLEGVVSRVRCGG